jgi:signal transduction histidine kinase
VAHDLPSLFAEEGKFKQIMYNLLSNAIKFTPGGGQVCVTAGIELATSGDSISTTEYLRIAVADTGIGIKVKDQERIFHTFEQVDSSYGRQQQGTGLGLALTQKLVKLHGGRIWVQSQGLEGKGSVFTFMIPIAKAEAGTTQLSDRSISPDENLQPLLDEPVGIGVNND